MAADSTTELTPRLTLLLAVNAGLGAANIYYAQPLIGLFQSGFGVGDAAAAQISTAAQLGYTIGLVFLVPLGDRFDRRQIVLVLTAALVLALLAAAVAPTLFWLVVASLAIGVAATVAQQAIPLAGSLASPPRRGAVVGRVISGLLAGILLARVVAGVVGEFAGWRAMFCMGAALAAALFVANWLALPGTRPAFRQSYSALLLSLVSLFRRHKALRRAAAVQGCCFGGFTAFWATLALHLKEPPFDLGADVAGLFGVLGLTGVLIAPWAGRMADRRGPWFVVLAGVVLVLSGWGIWWLVPGLPGLAAGVVVVDAGIQVTLTGNQADVFALDASAQSRLNTIFVAGIFLGGALGSVCGSLAWVAVGWPGIIGVGAGFTGLGLLVHLAGRSSPASARQS